MPHPYSGEAKPLPVHDLARAQQQGWLSFDQKSQYTLQRQMQGKRRPRDVPRRGKRAAAS